MTLVGIAARNLSRNKFRTGLTVLGVAVAVLTFTLLRTALGAWARGAEYAPKDRIVTRNRVTFVVPLPKRYVDEVRAVPHVTQVTFASWFGGKDPKNERELFATLAVDAATYFDVFTGLAVDPAAKATFLRERRGAIVGDMLAKKLGWKVGDVVTLESGIFRNDPESPWRFTIAGIYTAVTRSADRTSFLFHWDYLNESLPPSMKDSVGWITSRVDDAGRTADVGLAIDRAFEEKDIQTQSQDEHTFRNGLIAAFSAVLRAVDVISIVILAIMMLILGNTIAMGARERTNEYGVMRALGFRPAHIAGLIFGEAILTGTLGGIVGLGLAGGVVQGGLSAYLEETMGSIFPYFRLSLPVAAIALGSAVGLSAVASAIPAVLAGRLRVIDAIRRVA